MNIDISKIVSDKLAQLDADGIIKKKIEETVEKTVTDAITSELGSYPFRKSISDQVKQSVGSVAADCGFSAYNGFIANAVKHIVQDMYSADIADRVQKALNDALLQKNKNVKLSDIFRRYRTWVLENTEESEKYDRQEYTGELEASLDGAFTHYVCRFADRPLGKAYLGGKERGDIEIRFCVYGDKKVKNISSLYIDGHNMKDTLKIGTLSDFEAFVVNLYYNGTEIILDADDVDDDTSFDIDI